MTESAAHSANSSSATPANSSSAAAIALSWLVVLIPAVWGIYNTALRAAKLFQ